MHLSWNDIASWDRIRRLQLINSISGYKPANLIGTRSSSGQDNLAIFSSVVHLGSNPALLGMITRPDTVPRHTLAYIRETGCYTINHVSEDMIRAAHWTSADWPEDQSEFSALGIPSEEVDGFPAPFVAGAPVSMAMKLVDELPIQANGTILLIGKLEFIRFPDDALDEDGSLDYAQLASVAISGLNSYHSVSRISKFPYARTENWREPS